MWRAEQFGLGFLSELNQDFSIARAAAKAAEAERRDEAKPAETCGDVAGMVTTTTYASLAVLNIVRDPPALSSRPHLPKCQAGPQPAHRAR